MAHGKRLLLGEFIPEYRLGISYGTAFQAPTLGQLYGQRRFGIASNEHLKPEESKQWGSQFGSYLWAHCTGGWLLTTIKLAT